MRWIILAILGIGGVSIFTSIPPGNYHDLFVYLTGALIGMIVIKIVDWK